MRSATAFLFLMTNPHIAALAVYLRSVARMSKGKRKKISETERAARRLRMAHARSFRWKNFVSVGNPCEQLEKKENNNANHCNGNQ